MGQERVRRTFCEEDYQTDAAEFHRVRIRWFLPWHEELGGCCHFFVIIDVDPLPDFIELASVERRIGSQ